MISDEAIMENSRPKPAWRVRLWTLCICVLTGIIAFGLVIGLCCHSGLKQGNNAYNRGSAPGHYSYRTPQNQLYNPIDPKFIQARQYIKAMTNCNGYKSVVYFCNWAIYDRKHFPEDLPADRLTHVLYAFGNVNSETGEVFLTDKWADSDCNATRHPSTNGTQGGGCLGQLHKIKQKNRNLRVLLSIGGWTFSAALSKGVDTPEKRAKFANSALEILRQHCLDGLDVDWEYPTNNVEADNYVALLRQLRLELDSEALRKNLSRDQYDLTVAAPAGPSHMANLKIPEMDRYLSFWNLMTYDFTGSWVNLSGHHSNLYGGDISVDKAVATYINAGVHPSKLIMGMPLYGRSFVDTKGIGKSFKSVGNGSWEQGVWDYKVLPLNGAQEFVDKKAVGAYSYDKDNKTLITYDNVETARIKAQYVFSKRLGGGMWWESSGDFPAADGRSLIRAFTNELGINNLDTSRPNSLIEPSRQGPNSSTQWQSVQPRANTETNALSHQLEKTYF